MKRLRKTLTLGLAKKRARQLPRLALLLFLWLSLLVYGRETPMSYGKAAKVDTAILRLPLMKKAPEIDGVMSPGEWEDASALSGFWYDYAQSDFRFLAAIQTQLQVYAAYDKEHLYFAFTSPVYPKNSWLKARGRFPDVLSHPLYGTLWDDHLELELRPHDNLSKAFQLGLFRFDVNPLNNRVDWYWSQDRGQDMKWWSNARIRSSVTGTRWIVEFAIPFKTMIYGNYAGRDKQGRPYVKIPPPDGTVFRTWLVRGIGGNGVFFNAFDQHCWNTTKTRLILDSQAPSFQVNDLGPIMDDIINVKLTVKNHSHRSQTVQLGFFVENAGGTIYSSYDSPKLKDGLLELVPGEVQRLNLKKHFPGISLDDNVLWFDVRSAGRPAKQLFLTRLIRFHAMEGGVVKDRKMIVPRGSEDPVIMIRDVSFKERRLDAIAKLRPPRKDFDFRWHFSSYTKKISGVVDRGIHGASDQARRATEAKLVVMKADGDEDIMRQAMVPFAGDFACFLLHLPELVNGESYRLSLLLFDRNKRIVGERNLEPFTFKIEPWQHNQIGLEDIVWEPFTPMEVRPEGFSTLKHDFFLAPSGLPRQLSIKPDIRELPLEARPRAGKLPEAGLRELGRGPQLRAPLRFEVVIGGKRLRAKVLTPAKLTRQWQSELEYASTLEAGPIRIELTTRYDCDGSLHCKMSYGTAKAIAVDRFELVMDVGGQVDLVLSETGNGSMAGADVWEMTLPNREGVVWDSRKTQMELFFNKFVPYFSFGSADRAWTWYCDSDRGWILDRDGSTMQLERNERGEVTWRVQFINHQAELRAKEQRRIDFSILTHPAKPKPRNFRQAAWHYFAGKSWAAGYAQEPIDLPDEYLKKRWRQAAQAPKNIPWEQAPTWRKDHPPYYRYGQWRNIGVCAELDKTWEDKATYFFERHIRVGRRVGWWMDEYFPVSFGRSNNLAAGNAYLRDPKSVGKDELPWHSGFLTTTMRNHYKRLARVFAKNNVPQRQHTWSNNASNMIEPFIFSSLLVEECGAAHRSYEIDVITQFPSSLYRFLSKNHTGLVTTVCADATPATAGDDKRLDRNHFARALLNDIGVSPSGPHGIIHHKEQGVRLLTELAKFGFFEDDGTEKIPYWRNRQYVCMGDQDPVASRVYVTVYRRPLAAGRGFKALFVIVNESDEAVELPLILNDPKRILGGPNNLTAGAIRRQAQVPEAIQAWWQRIAVRDADSFALEDIESGQIVARIEAKAESREPAGYGPVYIPFHEFRVLYGQFDPAE